MNRSIITALLVLLNGAAAAQCCHDGCVRFEHSLEPGLTGRIVVEAGPFHVVEGAEILQITTGDCGNTVTVGSIAADVSRAIIDVTPGYDAGTGLLTYCAVDLHGGGTIFALNEKSMSSGPQPVVVGGVTPEDHGSCSQTRHYDKINPVKVAEHSATFCSPVMDGVLRTSPGKAFEEGSLVIYDLMGRVVFRKSGVINEVDLPETMRAGVYLLIAEGELRCEIQKITLR